MFGVQTSITERGGTGLLISEKCGGKVGRGTKDVYEGDHKSFPHLELSCPVAQMYSKFSEMQALT